MYGGSQEGSMFKRLFNLDLLCLLPTQENWLDGEIKEVPSIPLPIHQVPECSLDLVEPYFSPLGHS